MPQDKKNINTKDSSFTVLFFTEIVNTPSNAKMGNDNEKEDKEYEKLRREYRNMELNRKTLAEENQNVSSLRCQVQ